MNLLQSTIGKKIVVALTGLVLVGFVVAHMLGNLQIFLGPEKINAYGAMLKKEPLILWGARTFLLLAVLLHVLFTIQLTRRNQQSRPHAYEEYRRTHATAASRMMFWGGLTIFFFIIFHLLHYTVGMLHPHFSPTDIYSNMILGFSSLPVSLFYIFSMICLSLHLFHGVFSVFQTLGVQHLRIKCWGRKLAWGLALGIPAGFISIPLAVLSGWLH